MLYGAYRPGGAFSQPNPLARRALGEARGKSYLTIQAPPFCMNITYIIIGQYCSAED